MKKNVLKNDILVFLILISITLPIITVATIESDPLPSDRLLKFLGEIATLLFWIGAGFALIMIIVSGIMYIISSGDETKAKNAKKTLIYGLIGVAIIFAANFIISAVKEIVGRI